MSHRLRSYIARLRTELMSMLMMAEPEVWEQVRTAAPDAQIDALFKSPAIRRFICEHALGQAGYEKDGVVQRLRNGVLY
jgi:murein endopeptidase